MKPSNQLYVEAVGRALEHLKAWLAGNPNLSSSKTPLGVMPPNMNIEQARIRYGVRATDESYDNQLQNGIDRANANAGKSKVTQDKKVKELQKESVTFLPAAGMVLAVEEVGVSTVKPAKVHVKGPKSVPTGKGLKDDTFDKSKKTKK